MSNNEKNNNNNMFCSHTNKKKIIDKNKNKLYDYCSECGSVSLNHNNNYYYTIKPLVKQKELEIDPIKIVKEMINLQDKSHPYLNNVFNLNLNESSTKLQEMKEKIFLYLSKRKLLLLYLQNITKVLNYSDLSFYHCLLIMDLYLSHNISEKMSDEELLYILIGFFLIASKFKETDIFEPELYIFCNIDFDLDYILSVDKILFYEAKCLKLIGYDFFIYSTYDWLNIFMGIGYIFDGEIDKNNNEIINDINSYTFKLLITITPKNIFIKYSPMHNAISIIQICREDKIDKNRINNELFNKLLFVYNIKYKDYENCYNEIKSVINKTNENNNNKSANNQIRTLKRTENHKTLNEMNYYENEANKSGKRIIKFDTQRKLNIKQKLRDNKFQINLFSSNRKPKKRFGSINIANLNNKSRGIIKKQNTFNVEEYINDNLPKLNKIKNEGDKVFQTEAEAASGRNIKMLNVKNNILNDYLMKKIKNRSGASLDIKLAYNNGKSSLGFNKLLRNGTYDALKNNDIKINKKLSNENTINNNINKSKILNKSSDALKYNDNNTNNNVKNNNIILEIKNASINNNIINKGKKPFFRQGTSDYLQSNNIKIIKPEKSNIINNNKIENEITKNVESNKESKKKNPSIEKNKDKNNLIINNSNRHKFILSNLKYNKSNLNNINDILALKKLIFKNQKLPILKLNLDKK